MKSNSFILFIFQLFFLIPLLGLVKFSGALVDQSVRTFSGHEGWVNTMVSIPQSTVIVSSGEDKVLRFWKYDSDLPSYQGFTGHTDWVIGMTYILGTNFVASCSSDYVIYIWDITTLGTPIQTLLGHSDRVFSLAHIPSSTLLVSTSNDKTVRLWDYTSVTNPIRTFRNHTGIVTGVVYIPGTQFIISTGFDQKIIVWNYTETLDKNAIQRIIPGHTDWIGNLCHIKGTIYIATPSGDTTIKIWDYTQNITEIRTLTGHTSFIFCVIHIAETRFLISASDDSTIKIWDYTQTAAINTLTGHRGRVFSVNHIQGTRYFISGASDQYVQLWDIYNCHYSCDLCTIPNSLSGCSKCKENMNRDDRSSVDKTCPCLSGYADLGVPKCQPCHYSCITCSGVSETSCTSCPVGASRIDFSVTTQSCPCKVGFVDPGDPICIPCHYTCMTCFGGDQINQCTSCPDFQKRDDFSQLNSTCPCLPGYFDNGDVDCVECHYSCLTCDKDSSYTSCRTCPSTRVLSPIGSCDCQAGYFSTNLQLCSQCLLYCLSCTDSLTCDNCDNQRVFLNGECQCSGSTFTNSTLGCEDCSYQCHNCRTSSNNCIQCAPNRSTPPECPCLDGFYDDPQIKTCQPCIKYCNNCKTDPNGCELCSRNRIFVGGSCLCPDGYGDDPQGSPQCYSNCKDNCPICSVFKDCSCHRGKYFQKQANLCIKECFDSYYPNPLTYTCQTCFQNCLKCAGPSETDCLVCIDGFYKTSGRCQSIQLIVTVILFIVSPLLFALILYFIYLFCIYRSSNAADEGEDSEDDESDDEVQEDDAQQVLLGNLAGQNNDDYKRDLDEDEIQKQEEEIKEQLLKQIEQQQRQDQEEEKERQKIMKLQKDEEDKDGNKHSKIVQKFRLKIKPKIKKGTFNPIKAQIDFADPLLVVQDIGQDQINYKGQSIAIQQIPKEQFFLEYVRIDQPELPGTNPPLFKYVKALQFKHFLVKRSLANETMIQNSQREIEMVAMLQFQSPDLNILQIVAIVQITDEIIRDQREPDPLRILIIYQNGSDTIFQMIRQKKFHYKQIDAAIIWQWFQETIITIAELHEQFAIVHRNIKPENLILNRSGDLLLANFEKASKMVELEDQELNNARVTAEKNDPYYPPEFYIPNFSDSQNYAKADLFAIAIVFLEISLGDFLATQIKQAAKRGKEQYKRALGIAMDLLAKVQYGLLSQNSFSKILIAMLSYDPKNRPDVQTIVAEILLDINNRFWERQDFQTVVEIKKSFQNSENPSAKPSRPDSVQGQPQDQDQNQLKVNQSKLGSKLPSKLPSKVPSKERSKNQSKNHSPRPKSPADKEQQK